jgi:BMFP domain-containing protein YqiC
MQSDNRFFDDLAKLATGAAGALQGVRSEMQQLVRQQMERMLAELSVVPREEFDVVQAMAAAARQENESLAARVAALEARLAKLEQAAGESPPPVA